MAKLKVMRLEIAALTSDKERIISYLQRKGAAELSAPYCDYGFVPGDGSDKLSQLKDDLKTVEECFKAMHKLAPQSKPLTAMLEPRHDMTPEEFSSMSKDYQDTVKRAARIAMLYRQMENDEADIVRCETLIAELNPWKALDIPLHSGYQGGVAFLIGSVNVSLTRGDLLSELAKKVPGADALEIEVISQTEIQTCFTLICLKSDLENLENALREEGFRRAPEYPGITAAEKIAECKNKLAEYSARAERIKEAISNEDAFYTKLEFAKDYISIGIDKYSAFSLVSEKGSVFYINAYAAEKDAQSIKKHLEKHYDSAVEVSVPSEDEDVPVILSNNAFASPLENITGMYSMPSKGDMDPTGIMAFFYYFFFGMMLSDAGYGLIIVLLTGGVLLFKKNLERSMKNTCKMYLFCGISTVFWGGMYGSWFGDAASVIATNFLGKEEGYTPAFFKPWWTDAVTDLMHVLVLCFILGLVHLFVGVALKGITDIKNGNKFDAFCDTVPTYLTVIGIAPVFFNLFLGSVDAQSESVIRAGIYSVINTCHNSLSKVNVPILIVGLILVVATGGRSAKSIGGKIGGGLYEIYNLVGGYLGDVLSYARLLALGLATGVIAQVMNMLGTLPENKTLKFVLFIIVFIIGHIANLAINIIGAYVHTNRLQYVEFFGKFYEGGGRAFVPLKANTEFYKFKEEN